MVTVTALLPALARPMAPGDTSFAITDSRRRDAEAVTPCSDMTGVPNATNVEQSTAMSKNWAFCTTKTAVPNRKAGNGMAGYSAGTKCKCVTVIPTCCAAVPTTSASTYTPTRLTDGAAVVVIPTALMRMFAPDAMP